MKDEPKEEKPAKPEAKPAAKPKAEAKAPEPKAPEPARKIETKARGEFNTGRKEGFAYTHNRRSGQK